MEVEWSNRKGTWNFRLKKKKKMWVWAIHSLCYLSSYDVLKTTHPRHTPRIPINLHTIQDTFIPSLPSLGSSLWPKYVPYWYMLILQNPPPMWHSPNTTCPPTNHCFLCVVGLSTAIYSAFLCFWVSVTLPLLTCQFWAPGTSEGLTRAWVRVSQVRYLGYKL